MGGGRPISLSLNTGSGAPYFAIAQYGLRRALFRYRSIRAQARPIACGNTGFCYGYFARWTQYASAVARGCALLTPGCVLAPLQGAGGRDDWKPGVALCLPRAVFWRPFRALVVGTIGNPTPLIGEYVEFDGE